MHQVAPIPSAPTLQQTPKKIQLLKAMVLFLVCTTTLLILTTQVNTALTEYLETSSSPQVVPLKTPESGTFLGHRVTLHPSPSSGVNDPNAIPRSYFAFRGIPYALPPTGIEGRWKPPLPPLVRKPPRQATEYKAVCSQYDVSTRKVVGSPDCLYLNVFTPYIPGGTASKRPTASLNLTSDGEAGTVPISWTVENRNLLPVLVYIHGGEFITGSANSVSPERFMKEDVVLVTFNYRLGLLGLFFTGESDNQSLSGNYSILDQLEALRWIQENIYRFGGNPLRVCIFGNVEHLLLLQGGIAKGLFHSAILSSVSTSPLFSPGLGSVGSNDRVELFSLVAKEAGCHQTNQEDKLGCLKLLEIDSLIRIQHRLLKFFSYPQILHPTIGQHSLSVEHSDLKFNEGMRPVIPLMIGTSAYEGFNPFLEFYIKLGPNRTEVLKDKSLLMNRLATTLSTILADTDNDGGQLDPRLLQSIWEFYFGNMQVTKEGNEFRILWKLFRLFGDLTFVAGQSQMVLLFSKYNKAPVFNFIFNASSINKFPAYLEERVRRSGYAGTDFTTPALKTLHSSEMPPWKELHYLFYPPSSSHPDTPEREALASFLVKLWVSFANYGSPKQALSRANVDGKWGRGNEADFNYFVIGDKKMHHLKGGFRKGESKFWSSVLPQIRDLSQQINKLEPFPLLFWVFVGLTCSLVLTCLVLTLFICCSCRKRNKGRKGLNDLYDYSDDDAVILRRIPDIMK